MVFHGRDIVGLKLGHAVAAADKREPALNWRLLVRCFWWLMNRDTARAMLLFDAMFRGMRYDPHMAMEDTDSEKVGGVWGAEAQGEAVRATDGANRIVFHSL